MKAQVCIFKRREDTGWEKGIMIGTDSDETVVAIDQKGEPLSEVLDFRLAPELGCFQANFS